VTGVVVVMGPTGSGKSTVAPRVACILGLPFVDADDFHSADAVSSMRAGIPLTDEQRRPWLTRLNDELRRHRDGGVVVACSALTPEYRKLLSESLPDVRFVYLAVPTSVLAQRLHDRPAHYAGPALLPSQLEILELDDDVVTVDGTQRPDSIAEEIARRQREHRDGA